MTGDPSRGALLAILLVGCGSSTPAQPADLPEGTLLEWRVSQGLWGSERLSVTGDGVARYTFEPVAGSSDPPVDGTAQLSPSDLAHAGDALRAESVCSLDATRPGVPDEAVTHLAVDLGEGASCEVEVWDNDWRERAPQTHAFVRDWIRRARSE